MMMKTLKRAPKAYNNIPFLNNPSARTIRILAEYLEPMKRFQKEKIVDTIVFFGSARILPGKIASKTLEITKRKLLNNNDKTKITNQLLEDALIDVEMSKYYDEAVELAFLLTKWSNNLDKERRFVICSGGGPGIMEAANRGALKAKGKSIGLNISLPHEQSPNPYITKELNFEFHYFFMRKLWFMYLAKAMVMFPGGFGTIDEMMEVLTLVQTKKTTKHLPVILYGQEYWDKVLNFKNLIKYHTISKADMKLFTFANSPGEAFEYLKKDLTKFHLQKK
ncbi:MAG: TIGR00730 family Rossman fold protein [Bacteroidota bacterium]